jgi:hypothetical protein
VSTNSHGFRDETWRPGPSSRATRIAIVGDSYVYGSGVPEEDGLLHRQLSRALRVRAPGRAFEVMNVGHPGWGYFTYFPLAERVIAEFRPRIVVIGSLGAADWDLLDTQQQRDALGRVLFQVLGALGTVADLDELSLRYALGRLGGDAPWPAGVPGEARLAARFERLLAAAERAGTDVVVWDYYRPLPFFERFRAHPRVHFATWPAGVRWSDDPRYTIPVDHHPTAAGNALVADHLAPVLVPLLAAAGTP